MYNVENGGDGYTYVENRGDGCTMLRIEEMDVQC